ncbi:hydrogenase expression/formation protein HypE [Butyrivibrio sp. ob235]|uniref:hydrogenase expression/formation protein HypE n=1 Tax=unclassified Butyrivibrio TaxID=2639466 RepID=UPI0003B719C0|nr:MULTISPECIES: hydrogenase expression/formation protein HypE [unclassified Butyrivibrio]SEK42465.1 hydrogenase expression/formation protein HypE [Butyrivibrio sp. ob235]
MKVTMAHGSGGASTTELIENIFAKHFKNEYLDQMEDSAVVPGSGRLAVTTDSFVVTPYFFPGGDIGRLSVCGTVNDLLMSGAVPKYLTCGCILEEGMDLDDLDKIIESMAATAKEAGVTIITGDTKVVEKRGDFGGIMINTSGVGFMPEGVSLSPSGLKEGDVIIVSGNLGDHHAAILSGRMNIKNNIKSDNAPLSEMCRSLIDENVKVHAMRDVTRGGLGTVLHEFSKASDCEINIYQDKLPVSGEVRDFCKMLGLDPVYMGNEGKMICVVSGDDADKALSIIKSSKYGENATIIGEVKKADNSGVILHTSIGGTRLIGPLYGEGLPRIC